METFGKILKELRCSQGISQQKLANTLGLQRTTITNYESCKSLPNLELFVEIVKFFGVSSDLLLGLTDTTQIEHFKPKQAYPGTESRLHTWVGENPEASPRTQEEQARIMRLENRVNVLLEMAGNLSDEIQEIRASSL